MPQPNLLDIFIGPLNRLEIPYVVTGATAAIIYGEPRLTNDLDLVVLLKAEDVIGFVGAFPPAVFYCPPPEILRIEIKRPHRGHFNLIHHETGSKSDIYLCGDDELNRWALSQRRKIAVESEHVWVAPPEYVIIRKLQYYREGESEKHLKDMEGMLSLSSEQIDFHLMEEMVKRHGLEREWQKVRSLADRLAR
jgi:hypothetical protein